MVAVSKVERLNQYFGQLKNEREGRGWETTWRDIAEVMLPRKYRDLVTDRNRGENLHTKIINNTASLAIRTAAAGMMAGMTSPARPWFKFTLTDPELASSPGVREWLTRVEQIIRDDMIRSNMYQILHTNYSQLLAFGTNAFAMMNDIDTVLRGYAMPIGSFYLGQNSRRRVDACYRKFGMSTRQIVEEFGYENASVQVQAEYDAGNLDSFHDVVHAIVPNIVFRDGVIGPIGMPYEGVYYMDSGHDEKTLKEEGFREFPVIAPRWERTGEDVYGESPGMLALGDTKALQRMEVRFENAVELQIHPPLKAPMEMQNTGASLLPGRVSYYPAAKGAGSFEPLMQVVTDLGGILTLINNTEGRINAAFFADIFLMLTRGETNTDMTATEIAMRREERLLELGPVLESVNDDQNDPMLERWFNQENRLGRLPRAPESIQGQKIKVEYISIIAQAQKLLGINALDRYVGTIQTMSATHPTVVDKLNSDKAADHYGELLGADPDVIRDDEEVALIRAQREEQMRKMEQEAQLAQAAETMKTASQADTEGKNVLTDILGGQRA
jgi:hypothetical protein